MRPRAWRQPRRTPALVRSTSSKSRLQEHGRRDERADEHRLHGELPGETEPRTRSWAAPIRRRIIVRESKRVECRCGPGVVSKRRARWRVRTVPQGSILTGGGIPDIARALESKPGEAIFRLIARCRTMGIPGRAFRSGRGLRFPHDRGVHQG